MGRRRVGLNGDGLHACHDWSRPGRGFGKQGPESRGFSRSSSACSSSSGFAVPADGRIGALELSSTYNHPSEPACGNPSRGRHARDGATAAPLPRSGWHARSRHDWRAAARVRGLLGCGHSWLAWRPFAAAPEGRDREDDVSSTVEALLSEGDRDGAIRALHAATVAGAHVVRILARPVTNPSSACIHIKHCTVLSLLAAPHPPACGARRRARWAPRRSPHPGHLSPGSAPGRHHARRVPRAAPPRPPRPPGHRRAPCRPPPPGHPGARGGGGGRGGQHHPRGHRHHPARRHTRQPRMGRDA